MALKPGENLIHQGLRDLARRRETIAALLVCIGAPRLRRLGLPIRGRVFRSPEHRLYEKLRKSNPDASHSRYNALIRRLVSYERAAECVKRWSATIAKEASHFHTPMQIYCRDSSAGRAPVS